MQNFKQNYKKITLNIILLIVIISIIFTGIGNYIIKSDNNYIIKINGEIINLIDFISKYKYELNQQKKIYGNYFFELQKNKDFINKLQINIINQLTNEILLKQYAKKLKLKITDDKIKKFILENPSFKINNIFNNKKYLTKLNNMGLTVNQYINILKDKILIKEIIIHIINSDFALNKETKILLKLLHQKRIIQIAKINLKKYKYKNKINNKEIKEYYEINKKKYTYPEYFLLKFIKFDINKKINNKINNEEIKNWYKKNKTKFKQLYKKNYSIIQLKNKKDAKNIFKKIKHGANFGELAEKKSIDPFSSKNKGNIGWIMENNEPIEIKKANLKKVGQLSKIIKSSNSYLIIKLNKIKKQKQIINNIIISNIKKNKENNYINKINKIINKINKKNQPIEKIQQKIKIQTIKTKWFNIKNIPYEIKYKPIKKYLINYNKIKKIKIFKINNKIIILKINKYREKKIKPLKSIKKQITNEIKNEKNIKKAKKEILQIINSLNNNKNKYLKKLKIKFNKQETLTLNTDKKNINSIVFNLPVPINNPIYYANNYDKNHILLIKLIKVYNEKIKIKDINKYKNKFKKFNEQIIINTILSNLKHHASIKYNENIK